MSRLVEFYRGRQTDARGRRLHEIWDWDDDRLEAVHDFIQWLFPLPEPSRFNPQAPRLTDDDVAAFRSEPALREALDRSFQRLLQFLGLACTDEGGVTCGPNIAARSADVWESPNHNWLRITRILRSLKLLGLESRSAALFGQLSEFYSQRRFPIPPETFRYWQAAADGN